MKIKKGDQILVISGKDRGRKGKVIEVFPDKGRVVIEGINLKKKHVRPKRQGEKGQTVTVPASIDASDVKIICSKCGKGVRIGYRVEGKTKYRICRKCGAEI